jgi:hypothetical protein
MKFDRRLKQFLVDIIFSTSLPSHPHPSSIHFELHSNWGMTGVWLHALLIWSRWGCSGVEIDWLHELWYGVILQSYYWMRSVFQMYGELFEKCWRLPWHPAQLRMIWFGLYEWNQRSQLSPWRSLLTMWAILHVLISPSTLHSTPFLQNPSPYHIWEYILNLILIWHFCSNPDHLFNFNWNLWPSRPEKVNINHFDEHISFDIFPKSITKDFSLSRPFLDIYQNPNNANNLSLPAASKSLQIRHVEIY